MYILVLGWAKKNYLRLSYYKISVLRFFNRVKSSEKNVYEFIE